MASNPLIYAMIPARAGSTRLKLKNLALINGKPMISYAINAARDSGIFDKIIVNSENEKFALIAGEFGVEFYKRPEKLGSSKTKSDEVIADFINQYEQADILAWVNPIAPFQKGKDIISAVKYFFDKGLDSLITVEEKNVHCLYNGNPINYDPNEVFARTQDLIPIQAFAYTLMIWNTNVYKKTYNKTKSALFCGNFDTFLIDSLTGLIVKTKHDLMIADLIMSGITRRSKNYQVQYHPLFSKIMDDQDN